jgi:hypothetical protein
MKKIEEGIIQRESGVIQGDSLLFDQLNPKPEFLRQNFQSEAWSSTVQEVIGSPIARLFPASENGFRNVAVREFAQAAQLDLITSPGNDRELTWKQYLQITGDKKPDLVEYQNLVARSKHNRRRRMTERELEELGVYSEDRIEERTAEIAFDTIIMIWDGHQYLKREKPESEEEAIETIMNLTQGEPFIVSTVARVQSLMNSGEIGNAATLMPIKIATKNRFERAELQQRWIDLYREIASGQGKPWKITPAGGPSLMHPEIQRFVEVAASPGLDGNVLPPHFDTFDFVPTHSTHYQPYRRVDIGPLAYKKFAEKLGESAGYRKMQELPGELKQMAGMVISGYSDVGMREALRRYLPKAGKVGYSPLSRLRDSKLVELMMQAE